MKHNIGISCDSFPEIVLKMISSDEIEKLRIWKNNNVDSFFYKKIISPEEQKIWFDKYSLRNDDFMFAILYENNLVGSIGYRILNGVIDIYNVILGDEMFSSKGIMSKTIIILFNYLSSNYKYDITAKVLTSNPAINWYKKNGFEIVQEIEDYYLIRYDKSILKGNLKIKIVE
jgi:RimJ/RimL family protein N-acetyltransferase